MKNLKLPLLKWQGIIGIFFVVLLSGFLPAEAQSGRSRPGFTGGQNQQTHWVIGFKTGANATNPVIEQAYNILQPIHITLAEAPEKKYKSWTENIGWQFGGIVTYRFGNGLGLSLEPGFVAYQYGYNYELAWNDTENPSNALLITYEHTDRLHYMEIPLLIKYEFPLMNGWQPYVQAGGFYSLLVGSEKNIRTTGNMGLADTDFDANMRNQTLEYMGGFIGSAGIGYQLKYVQIGLDIAFRYGITTTTKDSERFTNIDLLSTAYDTPDELSIQNISTSLFIRIPVPIIL